MTANAQSALTQELGALTAAIPAPINEVIDAAVDAHRNRSSAALTVGDEAPDFELSDAHGCPFRLSTRLNDGPVVLSFYRGDWCPFCHIELRALQAALPRIRSHGASLVAVSPQSPDRALALSQSQQMTFDVLSDPDQRVIAAFGLRFEVAGDLKALYEGALDTDLSSQNADGSWNLPIPATYVIDSRRQIRTAHVDPDYRTRLDVEQITEAFAIIQREHLLQ